MGHLYIGFAIERDFSILRPNEAYFLATHSTPELDLLPFAHGKRYGIEAK